MPWGPFPLLVANSVQPSFSRADSLDDSEDLEAKNAGLGSEGLIKAVVLVPGCTLTFC